jgi:hypothetical protein
VIIGQTTVIQFIGPLAEVPDAQDVPQPHFAHQHPCFERSFGARRSRAYRSTDDAFASQPVSDQFVCPRDSEPCGPGHLLVRADGARIETMACEQARRRQAAHAPTTVTLSGRMPLSGQLTGTGRLQFRPFDS